MVTPGKPFKVSGVVQLPINERGPTDLRDGFGRSIDGDRNGTAGGEAVTISSRRGAAVQAVASWAAGGPSGGITEVVNARHERDDLAGLTPARRARRPRLAASE